MTLEARSRAFQRRLCGLALVLCASIVLIAPGGSSAQVRPSGKTTTPATGGIQWDSLDPATKKALAPLERDWSHLESRHKEKWVELSQRLPKMSPAQQQRIQARMADWARMTPAERGQARLRFMQAQRTGVQERGERWGTYQALPNDQKKQFAARAAAPLAKKPRTGSAARNNRPDADNASVKSNLVTNPNFGAQPRTIAPTMLKAGPGASTTMVSKTPSPPPHQQTGMPKIAASPGFVDKATLLPKRGPQGAAAAATKDPDEQPQMVPRP